MKTVLLPTDFSEASQKAVRYALHLFQDQVVRYILLHVHDLSSHMIDMELAALRNTFAEKPKRRLHREFISLIEETDQRNAKFEVNIEYGDEVRTILHYVTARQVDYVVLGLPSSKRGFQWMGNRVGAIMRKASCPVIVVPEKACHRKPGKIILTSNARTGVTGDHFSYLRLLAKEFRAQMHVVCSIDRSVSAVVQPRKSGFGKLWEATTRLARPLTAVGSPDHLQPFLDGEETGLLAVPQTRGVFAERLFRRSAAGQLATRGNVPLLSLPV